MKRSLWLTVLVALGFGAAAQKNVAKTPAPKLENTLLWRVSGNNLQKPSYLFGTMHMLCASDIELSDSLKKAIGAADKVYLELDMDDIMQMMSAMTHMTMREDTTLADLLSPADYKKVKAFFEKRSLPLPFSVVERYKPLLVESMVMEGSNTCDNMVMMDQLVMEEAKQNDLEIKGLETMDYQLSIFDSIPYKLQAQQLVKMVDDSGKSEGSEDKEMAILTDAYRRQQLDKLDELTKDEDMGMKNFTNLLLYNRNANWAKKLQTLMARNALVVAVGAGHLPGEKGLINLLRQAGYTVEPVKNEMQKKKVKEI